MITAGDFRNGKTFEYEGKLMMVVEFQHVKPGKGAAFVRTKMKNIVTGAVTETSFNPTAKFEEAFIDRIETTYSYNDGDLYYFMDNETYEQIPVSADFIGDSVKWFKENDNCQLLYADTELLGVQPPMFIEVEITETDPGFKGDTVQGGTKPATIETGAVIQVPMYLNQGEVIKVDTRDGKFVSRV